MNIGKELEFQKLLEVLEQMELTGENRAAAERYLDMDLPEDQSVLKNVERQDFSQLDEKQQTFCKSYHNQLHRRHRTEEEARFVRFAAAVGGSTACYVTYVNTGNSIYQYDLSPALKAAIWIEHTVWREGMIKAAYYRELYEDGRRDPQIIADAIGLCFHQYMNSRILMRGIYLYFTEPGSDGPAKEAVAALKKSCTGNLTVLMPDLEADEKKTVAAFLENSSPDDEIPAEVDRILTERRMTDYMVRLLGSAAFLAVRHSTLFVNVLRLLMRQKLVRTLDACREISDGRWFEENCPVLEEQMQTSGEQREYLNWYADRARSFVPRESALNAVRRFPEAARAALETLDIGGCYVLLGMVKEADPQQYRSLREQCGKEILEKTVDTLLDEIADGRMANRGQSIAAARSYLLGFSPVEALYPSVQSWRIGQEYSVLGQFLFLSLLWEGGDTNRRARTFMALIGKNTSYFDTVVTGPSLEKNLYPRKYITDASPEDINALLDMLKEERLLLRFRLEALETLYNGLYDEKKKTLFLNSAVQALEGRTEERDEYIALSKDGTAFVRLLCIEALDKDWQRNEDAILSCASDGAKQVREALTAICFSHREWEPKILQMLCSKKSTEREFAAQVLRQWGAQQYQEEFRQALAKEKSRKLQTLLQELLGGTSETAKEPRQETGVGGPVKSALKDGRARKIAWLYKDGAAYPQVRTKDGKTAEEDDIKALLLCYADMDVPGPNAESARIAQALNAGDLAAYVRAVYDKWLSGRAEAKKKWVLYAASIHGGDGIVGELQHQIQEWPQQARGAMAAEAVRALALNGSPNALLIVDQISRKFKFRQVKEAAGAALTYAAEQLGISRAELEDRIVPNLGFDSEMKRTFDYGARSFDVYLNQTLELEVFNGNGKKVKTLPTPGKKDDEEKANAAYAGFKALKKQLKTVAANQKIRLEEALSAERTWTPGKWRALFVENPVMHRFATGLIWGLYGEDGALKETFRYMEDGSFNTVDEDEYELPDAGRIGLVHPLELDGENLQAWREQLSDYEITQPLLQLDRPVYRMTEEEKGQEELTRFGGMVLNGLSLSGKLQGQGWYRGSVQDAGGYYTFYREDGAIGVELEFSGAYVGDENEDVTVYGAAFYKAGTVKRGSYVYDTIKKENRYALGEVNPRYFSEIVLQLAKATASSTKQLAYPDCRRRN